METIAAILRDKGNTVFTVDPQTTVLRAVETMCVYGIGSVLVCDGEGQPCGIFTERDLMTQVILARRDPEGTRVEEVMTSDVVCVEPTTGMREAMAIMTEKRCRHLPVIHDGLLVGLVSIGDLVRCTSRNQEYEIRVLNDYITGRYPA